MSFLALIDKDSSKWTMSHFIDLVKYNKLLKMLDTSTSICHHIVHFSMLQNGVFGHQEPCWTWYPKSSNINDDVWKIIAHMVQGWIREVNQIFGRASCGEWLGESYTWCVVLCETKLYTSWNGFCEVVSMGYQIMQLFTTCREIGWNFNLNWLSK